MSQHQFAIRVNGRTLGVKDVQQLARLITKGSLGPNDKVFSLSDKRWLSATDIPGLNARLEGGGESDVFTIDEDDIQVEPVVEAAPIKPEPISVKPKADAVAVDPDRTLTGQALNSLLDNLDGGVEEESESISPSEPSLSSKTIHKMSSSNKRSTRLTDAVVAAKVPNPEGRRIGLDKAAVFVAVMALLFGMAVGLFGSTLVLSNGDGQTGAAILQAQTPSSSSSDTN